MSSSVPQDESAVNSKKTLRIDFPPVKTKEEVVNEQKAAPAPDDVRKDMQEDIPPVIRSVLELAHLMMSGHSQWLHASPGYQGGLYYDGKPYCFASGYRDGTRPRDMEDKGNHMKLKDPLVYGTLSLPITAAYLCELHGKEIFDLNRPIVDYLPSLTNKVSSDVTARSILSFTTVVDDSALLKDIGVHRIRPYFSPNICAATQKHIYEPINRFFAGGSKTSLNGKQQREHLALYVGSASNKIGSFIKKTPKRASISHFSVAILMAAVETQLKGKTFESSIRETFFEPGQCHGSGYGPPKLYRDPNEMFYQPTGLAQQHQSFFKPVPTGGLENCAPPLFNASMNLYAPVEDFGKLLLLSLDTIHDARELFGNLPGTSQASYYDFGVQVVPKKDVLQLNRNVFTGIDFLPASASFRYNSQHDLGCFGIANCGTRGGRFFSDTLSQLLQYLFVKHVIDKGVDASEPVDLDNPTKSHSETEEKFKKVVKKQEFKSFFTKHDSHTRF